MAAVELAAGKHSPLEAELAVDEVNGEAKVAVHAGVSPHVDGSVDLKKYKKNILDTQIIIYTLRLKRV